MYIIHLLYFARVHPIPFWDFVFNNNFYPHSNYLIFIEWECFIFNCSIRVVTDTDMNVIHVHVHYLSQAAMYLYKVAYIWVAYSHCINPFCFHNIWGWNSVYHISSNFICVDIFCSHVNLCIHIHTCMYTCV